MLSSDVAAAIDLLGYRMKDKITGQVGVATSVCFDLYGCIQVTIHPGLGADGKALEQFWFDVARLDKVDDQRVMELPAFARQNTPNGIDAGDGGYGRVQSSHFANVGGPAEKPSRAP